jgi:hypothetical protein
LWLLEAVLVAVALVVVAALVDLERVQGFLLPKGRLTLLP